MTEGCFQKNLRAENIGFDKYRRVFDRAIYVTLSGEIDDAVDATIKLTGDDRIDQLRVLNLAVDKFVALVVFDIGQIFRDDPRKSVHQY